MTHLEMRLMFAKETYNELFHIAIAPLMHWSNAIRLIPEDSDPGYYDQQVTLNMLTLPLFLVLNTISLSIGILAASIYSFVLGFQAAYALYQDKNSPTVQEDIEELSTTLTAETDQQKTWYELLEFGRWAPSPHNMQPWVFKLEEDNTTTIFYDPKRLLPGTNPTGSFMVVAFGILIETLSIAAAPLGLDVEATYLHENRLDSNNSLPQALANLKLVPRKSVENLDRHLIIKRQTSRLPYNGEPLSPELIKELEDVAARYGHKMGSSTEQSEVDWVVRLNANTMFYDMSLQVAREEVASWMRFSKAEAVQRADGLASYAMNVPGWQMWLFVHANWMFRIPGVYQLIRHSYEQTMAGTATVAWLSGPFENHQDWDNAGRMMARWWLTMTKHGVYLHPFGSVITNPDAHKEMVEHFKDEKREHDLWMLARLGKSEDQPPKAQRIPLSEMIVGKNRYSTFGRTANQSVHETFDEQSNLTKSL